MKTERRRIWLLDGSVAVTGAFVSAREIARLMRDEAEVVLVLPRRPRIAQSDLGDFAHVHHLPIRPLRRNLPDILLYLPCLLWAAIRLRVLLWRGGADTLLVNDFYLVQGALVRLLGFRGRIVTWVRINPGAFGWVAGIWLWCAAKASQHVVAVSRFIQDLLPPNLHSTVVHNSISAEFLPEPSSRTEIKPSFVFLGNYILGKGQNIAIEAMNEVLKTCPDAHLTFYGGDMGLDKNRAYRRTLEHLAKELGLAGAVHFGDAVSSPRTVLLGHLAALNLSQSEAFSRTVLEASACGLPVIVTRCGGPEEIIADGHTGLILPVDDVRACAEAMRMLCENPEYAARMGAAGRKRVVQLFAPDTIAKRLKAVLIGKK